MWREKIVISNLILFFLYNFKSTVAMVTPKIRIIQLNILNKIMFGKYRAVNILAVVLGGDVNLTYFEPI